MDIRIGSHVVIASCRYVYMMVVAIVDDVITVEDELGYTRDVAREDIVQAFYNE